MVLNSYSDLLPLASEGQDCMSDGEKATWCKNSGLIWICSTSVVGRCRVASIATTVAFVSICIDDRLCRCFLFHGPTVIPSYCRESFYKKRMLWWWRPAKLSMSIYIYDKGKRLSYKFPSVANTFRPILLCWRHVFLIFMFYLYHRSCDFYDFTPPYNKHTGRNPSHYHVEETPTSPPTVPSKDHDAMQP